MESRSQENSFHLLLSAASPSPPHSLLILIVRQQNNFCTFLVFIPPPLLQESCGLSPPSGPYFPPSHSCSSIPLLLSESKFWRSSCVKITQEHGRNYVMGQMQPTNKNLLTLFPEKNPQLEPDISSTYLRNKGELPLLHRGYCPLFLQFCNKIW